MLIFYTPISDGRYYCLCGKNYKYQESWYRHKRECGSEKKFYCDICYYKTHRSDNLKRHILTKHIIKETKISWYNIIYILIVQSLKIKINYFSSRIIFIHKPVCSFLHYTTMINISSGLLKHQLINPFLFFLIVL